MCERPAPEGAALDGGKECLPQVEANRLPRGRMLVDAITDPITPAQQNPLLLLSSKLVVDNGCEMIPYAPEGES